MTGLLLAAVLAVGPGLAAAPSATAAAESSTTEMIQSTLVRLARLQARKDAREFERLCRAQLDSPDACAALLGATLLVRAGAPASATAFLAALEREPQFAHLWRLDEALMTLAEDDTAAAWRALFPGGAINGALGELYGLVKEGREPARDAWLAAAQASDGDAAECTAGQLVDLWSNRPALITGWWPVLREHRAWMADAFEAGAPDVLRLRRLYGKTGPGRSADEIRAFIGKLKDDATY